MKKQEENKAIRKSATSPKQTKARNHRLVEFPQARGRTVEMVELSLDSEFHCISIRFQDDTDLTFVIDPALTFQGRLFQSQGRQPESAQALADLPYLWPVT